MRDLTVAYYVNSKRQTLIRGKSIHKSFRGSILGSIIAECKRKLSVELFGASTKMVDFETPNCEQQAVPAKSARRKECDQVRSALRFNKQSHVTKIVNVWRHNQRSLQSLNLWSTCFSSKRKGQIHIKYHSQCHSQKFVKCFIRTSKLVFLVLLKTISFENMFRTIT